MKEDISLKDGRWILGDNFNNNKWIKQGVKEEIRQDQNKGTGEKVHKLDY